MKILDVKLKKETENYKFFSVHYTPWWNSDSIKFRDGFVIKNTNDCFWSNTGKRINAWTERAVLAWVDDIESENPINIQKVGRVDRELNDRFNAVLDQITYTKK